MSAGRSRTSETSPPVKPAYKSGHRFNRARVPRAAVVLALLLLGLVFVPLAWLGGSQTCAVRQFLGVDCPGCGLVRSWVALSDLDWRKAFALYPLGPFIYLGIWLYIIDEGRVYVMGDRWSPLVRRLSNSRLALCLVGMILIQWIAKLAGLW